VSALTYYALSAEKSDGAGKAGSDVFAPSEEEEEEASRAVVIAHGSGLSSANR